MTQPIFIGSEIYRGSSYGAAHPLHIARVSTVMDLTRALGWLPQAQYRTSPRAKAQALAVWHEPDYLDALQQAEERQSADAQDTARFGLGTTANPVFPEMFRRPATGAGGVMLAADLVAGGGVVHVPGGGTHHAFAGRANGFCYLNDPVLCLLRLRAVGCKRIAYLDLDAHHCDGVEAGLSGADDMLLLSVHEERRWPFTGALEDQGAGRAINLPVPKGLNDTEARYILHRFLVPLLEDYAPDAIVLQCGADSLEDDPLSRLALSNNAYIEALQAIRPLAPRLIVLGGGGYNPWSVGRLWTRLWGALNGQDWEGALPESAQDVLRGLSWNRQRGQTRPEHWITTLADPAREGPVRQEIVARVDFLRMRHALQGRPLARGAGGK